MVLPMSNVKKEFIIERNGCDVHYWISGSLNGPIIFFVHGAAVDHTQFDLQLPCLAENYQIIRIDMRGHGKSRPLNEIFRIEDVSNDIISILDELGVDDAIFIGQSAGTYAIQELAFQNPERVKSMVLVDGTCITSKLSFFENISLKGSPIIFRLWPYNNLKKDMAKGSATKPETRKYLKKMFNELSREEFIKIWDGISSCIHHEPKYNVKFTFLLVYGVHDNLGNIKKSMKEWADRESMAEYVVIPDAGHASNQDNPEFFNQVMIHFLKEVI